MDPRVATRGVQVRLLGAVGLATLTVVCVLAVIFAPQFSYDTAFLMAIGGGSLALAIALILSARREEIVHHLARDLAQRSLAPADDEVEPSTLGEDGSLLLESPERHVLSEWSWEAAEASEDFIPRERPPHTPYSPR
ncbi:hypothetical protein DL240_16065 [Lujinxingia litoralis]|uniref:Uncharacterized protein n=1 Tax=Lujinxingia litoralis TaxID=2211119 RepID=A0A328C6D2_9DELT|nr:hypothetical protein DL240_16065 [Lujinxingia litoralis]